MQVHARPVQPLTITIEVCVDSVESAVAAVRGGANRLEVCASLGYGGGITPSIGLLQSIQNAVPTIPIMAMVRPRPGDFVYSKGEINVMLQDITAFKEHGVQGVVFGALTAIGDVDESHVSQLISAAAPLEVCFHRAFDMTRDTKDALNTLCRMPGITRVLTSGHSRYASSDEALKVLKWMLDSVGLASSPVGVLPGSGINISTISTLCNVLLPYGLKEIHMSGGKWVDSRSAYRPDEMGMGEWKIWKTDEDAVREVRDFVDRFCAMQAVPEIISSTSLN